MPEVNMQPLRDLLATHPEECAAVVAILANCGLSFGAGYGIAERDIDTMLRNVGVVVPRRLLLTILNHATRAGALRRDANDGFSIPPADRYAIARMGAAAWLREKCRMGSRAPRYEHEAAIVARVAHVLGCSPGNVRLGWRSGALDSIGVCRGNGPELCGDDVAALFRAGFSVSFLGWDVPADCVGDAAKEDGEQR